MRENTDQKNSKYGYLRSVLGTFTLLRFLIFKIFNSPDTSHYFISEILETQFLSSWRMIIKAQIVFVFPSFWIQADPYVKLTIGKHVVKDRDNYVPKQLNPSFGRSVDISSCAHLLMLKDRKSSNFLFSNNDTLLTLKHRRSIIKTFHDKYNVVDVGRVYIFPS